MKAPIIELQSNCSNTDLLSLFWDLQGSNVEKRLIASSSLLNAVLHTKDGNKEFDSQLEYTFSRLVQGLTSESKQTKLGFSTALTHLLANIPSTIMNSQKFLYLFNNQLSASDVTIKSTSKEFHLGHVFCLLSLIKSNKLANESDVESMAATVAALIKLSNKKPYLKRMAYHGLQELIVQVDDQCFKEGIWSSLFPILKLGWEQSSIEVLHLLLTCVKFHPETCGKNFLRSCSWIGLDSGNEVILNKQAFGHLSRMLSESTICHPNIDNFVYDIVSTIGKRSSKQLVEFWTQFLHKSLFQSSADKKYLGFHLAIHSLLYLKPAQVSSVWSNQVITLLHQVMLQKKHPLNEVCRINLPKQISLKLSEDSINSKVQYAFLFTLFSSPASVLFDQVTHTRTISSVVHNLKFDGLLMYISWLKKVFIKGFERQNGIEMLPLDAARRWSCNQLAQLVQSKTLLRYEEWVSPILTFLFFHAHFKVKLPNKTSKIKEISELDDHFMNLSDLSRTHVLKSLTSILNSFGNMESLPYNAESQKTLASQSNGTARILGVMSSGWSWLFYLLHFAEPLLSEKEVELVAQFSEPIHQAWSSTVKNLMRTTKLRNSQSASSAEARVLELLLAHVGFQLLSTEPAVQHSSVEVLNDLEVVINERFVKQKPNSTLENSEESFHWVEVVIEIILSLYMSESRGVRSVGEQAFRILCPLLTRKALQLILDVLLTKNQNNLIEIVDDDDDDDANEVEEDEISGDEISDEEDEEDNDIESNEDEEEDVDELFRSEIRQALGEAALPVEEMGGSEDEELNDDAMIKLDSLLSEVFKRRKKSSSGNPKRQMATFQIRCLNLIEIFISHRHNNSHLLLDLPLPLLDIIEKSSNSPNKKIITERASIILRAKLCRYKKLPRSLDDDTSERCYGYLEQLLEMGKKGSRSVFISHLMSHCCLFYLRALSSATSGGEARMCTLYSALLRDFMLRRQSKVQLCFISDFVQQFPEIGCGLAKQLIIYATDAVQPYRKLQACLFLSTLCRSERSRHHMEALSVSLRKACTKILKRTVKSCDETNSKLLTEIIRLLNFAVTVNLKKCESEDWSKLIGLLEEVLTVTVAKSSQACTNNIWKLLQSLGVSRPKVTKQKRKKSRGNTSSDEGSDVELPVDELSFVAGSDVELPVASSDGEESTRKLKVRVMKEKKKRAKKVDSGKTANKTNKPYKKKSKNKASAVG